MLTSWVTLNRSLLSVVIGYFFSLLSIASPVTVSCFSLVDMQTLLFYYEILILAGVDFPPVLRVGFTAPTQTACLTLLATEMDQG